MLFILSVSKRNATSFKLLRTNNVSNGSKNFSGTISLREAPQEHRVCNKVVFNLPGSVGATCFRWLSAEPGFN